MREPRTECLPLSWEEGSTHHERVRYLTQIPENGLEVDLNHQLTDCTNNPSKMLNLSWNLKLKKVKKIKLPLLGIMFYILNTGHM